MQFIRRLVPPPDIGKLIAERNVSGLIKALQRNDIFDSTPVYQFEEIESVLVEEGGRNVVQSLIQLLFKDDGPYDMMIRGLAARGLMRIGDPRAVEALILVLENDSFSTVRQSAAKALGTIGDSRAVEPLRQALQDTDGDVRQAAKTALERF